MTDKELAALRKKASQALGKAINHLETTAIETRIAARAFEAKIIRCENEQAQRVQRLHLLN